MHAPDASTHGLPNFQQPWLPCRLPLAILLERLPDLITRGRDPRFINPMTWRRLCMTCPIDDSGGGSSHPGRRCCSIWALRIGS